MQFNQFRMPPAICFTACASAYVCVCVGRVSAWYQKLAYINKCHIDLFVFYLISVISVSLLPNQPKSKTKNQIFSYARVPYVSLCPLCLSMWMWMWMSCAVVCWTVFRCAITTEQFPGHWYRRDRSHIAMVQADAFQREYCPLWALLEWHIRQSGSSQVS